MLSRLPPAKNGRFVLTCADMAGLAAVFREACRGTTDGPTAVDGDDGELGTRLAELCARGRAAFPELRVADEAFVRHLACCVIADEAGERGAGALGSMAIEDLYLACACLAGIDGAIAEFDARCSASIRTAVAAMTSKRLERDEVEQQLRTELFVGAAGAPPKIRSYRGHAPLRRWAAVAARRLAISMLRSVHVEGRVRENAALAADLNWTDPAVALAKHRYYADFRRALEEAISQVGDRERMLLRLHLVKGATTRKIAEIYRVSQPTASRWLDQARARILEETQRLLRERLKLSAEEIESLVALIKSQLDLSLSRILQPSASAQRR